MVYVVAVILVLHGVLMFRPTLPFLVFLVYSVVQSYSRCV